jgi:hypothetical protein
MTRASRMKHSVEEGEAIKQKKNPGGITLLDPQKEIGHPFPDRNLPFCHSFRRTGCPGYLS